MADQKPTPDSDDQDSWENLAKDLFGIEFDSQPAASDDLEDDLLDDDFLGGICRLPDGAAYDCAEPAHALPRGEGD